MGRDNFDVHLYLVFYLYLFASYYDTLSSKTKRIGDCNGDIAVREGREITLPKNTKMNVYFQPKIFIRRYLLEEYVHLSHMFFYYYLAFSPQRIVNSPHLTSFCSMKLIIENTVLFLVCDVHFFEGSSGSHCNLFHILGAE